MKTRLKFFTSLILTILICSCKYKQDNFDQHTIIRDSLNTSFYSDSVTLDIEDTTLNTNDYNPDSIFLEYMSKTFIKNTDTIHISNKTLGMTNCGWKFNYKGGHSYEFSECQEMGYVVKIKIMRIKKNELMKFIDQKCFRPNYSWYNDSTEYRPSKYYESVWTFKIEEGKGFNIVEISKT